MDNMKSSLRYSLFISLVLIAFTASCATTKTLHVWKDEGYNQQLGKVLVIVVAKVDFMRNHFENVLAENLASRGVEAWVGNKVFPQEGDKLDREAIAAKVRELGIGSVLVARSVNQEEVSKLYPGGIMVVPADYYHGWYGFYSDSMAFVSVPGRAYDAEYFTLVTNVYDVSSEKLIWTYLAQVKVEGSREGAINPFIATIIKQLEASNLIAPGS
jgi:hypothetical protein